jgi:hypothetical protein
MFDIFIRLLINPYTRIKNFHNLFIKKERSKFNSQMLLNFDLVNLFLIIDISIILQIF